MSPNAHAIMFESERSVSAARIPSRKILTHFADIPVVRAVVIVRVVGANRTRQTRCKHGEIHAVMRFTPRETSSQGASPCQPLLSRSQRMPSCEMLRAGAAAH